jgi:hypothetical protein
VEVDPSIQAIPQRLDEIIDYAFPNALMVGATCHSDDVYSIYILDLDYSYTRWLASLSLDNRWSLSPR